MKNPSRFHHSVSTTVPDARLFESIEAAARFWLARTGNTPPCSPLLLCQVWKLKPSRFCIKSQNTTWQGPWADQLHHRRHRRDIQYHRSCVQRAAQWKSHFLAARGVSGIMSLHPDDRGARGAFAFCAGDGTRSEPTQPCHNHNLIRPHGPMTRGACTLAGKWELEVVAPSCMGFLFCQASIGDSKIAAHA